MTIEQLVDRFVERVNRRYRPLKMACDLPPGLRAAEPHPGFYDWQIQRTADVPWFAEFEARLPKALPASFRALVSRYEFPAFEAGPIVLFANTREGTAHELRRATRAEPVLTSMLLQRGLLPFARPRDWQCDPVCFDMRETPRDGEYPVVRVDHEALLARDEIRIVERLASSFVEILES